jgi:uncharacterized protein (TIGR02118 family)
MIKRMSLLTRRPQVNPEEFRAHWFTTHAEILKRELPSVRGYVQNLWLGPGPNPLRPPGPHRIDGIVELWFENAEAMDAAFASQGGATLMEDGRQFIETVTTFVVEERVMIPGPRGKAKFIGVFNKRPHLTDIDFRRQWAVEHPPHVRLGVPHAVRYAQSQVIDSAHRHVLASAKTAVDGFVEISWQNADDMAADMQGPTIDAMRADADRFIETISGSRIEEQIVIPPPS